MSKPARVLLWMFLFLAAVAALALLLQAPLRAAFAANPAFNGLIITVLLVGIAINVRQILALQREARWLELFRRSAPDRPLPVKPRLLAPMARIFASRERAHLSLNATTLRSLLDGVQLRLEESRELSRYLVGLLVFLGLLGTFYGLLVTIASVGSIIAGLSVDGDGVAMFEQLKDDLRQPLAGMGTAFSTSLFGLAGSLVLGFVDLQAAQAQNRFFNALEDWLAGMTRLGSAGPLADAETSVPAYVQGLLEQTAEEMERIQRALVESERERRGLAVQLQELSAQLERLSALLGREHERNESAQAELRALLHKLAGSAAPGEGLERLSETLRGEIRLLSRTLAAALGPARQDPP